MATDGAKAPGEEEGAVDGDWQYVQSPDSPPSLRFPPSSSCSIQRDTNHGVAGGDDFLQLPHRRSSSVFPPLHHEGLDRLPPPRQLTTPPPSSSPPSPSPSPSSSSSSPSPPNGTENEPPQPPAPPSSPPAGILRSGAYGIASRVRRCVLLERGFWSFGSAAAMAGAVAAVLLSLAYTRMRRSRWRWWRRDRVPVEASENRLLLLIRDKDQKISQLLLQVAQMNELMLARRRVQVLRVGG